MRLSITEHLRPHGDTPFAFVVGATRFDLIDCSLEFARLRFG